MAFSNTWDTTFPPDTQLANLLGQDIRNGVKVDVQQRMAAISGLDAAKPAFGSDAQPANWNGILFFATDTGHVYQFNNPSWTDVTTNFVLKSTALKTGVVVNHTGTVTNDTIYSLIIPAGVIGANGRVRIILMWIPISGNSSGSNTPKILFGGTVVNSLNTTTGAFTKSETFGGNANATNSQNWFATRANASDPSSLQTLFTSAVDTTVPVTVSVTQQNALGTDSQTFYGFSVEWF